MNEEQLNEIEARAKLAEQEIDDLNHRRHEWRMCIPVQDTDSDVVLIATKNDVLSLLAEVRRLQEIEAHAVAINNGLLTGIQSVMQFLPEAVRQRFQEALQPVIDLMETMK